MGRINDTCRTLLNAVPTLGTLCSLAETPKTLIVFMSSFEGILGKHFYGFGTYCSDQYPRSAFSEPLLECDLDDVPFSELAVIFPDQKKKVKAVQKKVGARATCREVAEFMRCPAVVVSANLCTVDNLSSVPTEEELHHLAERQQAHFEDKGYCASPKQYAKWLKEWVPQEELPSSQLSSF